VAALAARLCAGGTLSLILPAAQMGAALGALDAAQCGAPWIFPLWKRAGQEAKLVLLRAHRLRRGPSRILPGLTLHGAPPTRFTRETHAILTMETTEDIFPER
jgi:tRNA1Val (adenine37-N6)-methyltransferase